MAKDGKQRALPLTIIETQFDCLCHLFWLLPGIAGSQCWVPIPLAVTDASIWGKYLGEISVTEVLSVLFSLDRMKVL